MGCNMQKWLVLFTDGGCQCSKQFWTNQKLQGSRILADLPQVVQQEVGIPLGFENMVFGFEVPGHLWTVMQSVNLDVHSLLEYSQKRLTHVEPAPSTPRTSSEFEAMTYHIFSSSKTSFNFYKSIHQPPLE